MLWLVDVCRTSRSTRGTKKIQRRISPQSTRGCKIERSSPFDWKRGNQTFSDFHIRRRPVRLGVRLWHTYAQRWVDIHFDQAWAGVMYDSDWGHRLSDRHFFSCAKHNPTDQRAKVEYLNFDSRFDDGRTGIAHGFKNEAERRRQKDPTARGVHLHTLISIDGQCLQEIPFDSGFKKKYCNTAIHAHISANKIQRTKAPKAHGCKVGRRSRSTRGEVMIHWKSTQFFFGPSSVQLQLNLKEWLRQNSALLAAHVLSFETSIQKTPQHARNIFLHDENNDVPRSNRGEVMG
ncbi:hypothetical protein C8R45DRAFT_927986 [Mycena sanguinolenta]|nr:hypothetical protein C8R45DRAFT_927986 [Mycena sanguinolenta]